MTLGNTRAWKGDDGRQYRSEQWTITGGEVDPSWRRKMNSLGEDVGSYDAEWEPSSHFTLYVVDGEVDVRLVSYGGVVWPIAWPQLFETRGEQGWNSCVAITDLGLQFRSAALHGASDMYADVRLS
jgi:hypothetical protein